MKMTQRTPNKRGYSKTPSRLPRIDTPPEHDAYRSNSDLRRDSFETVPPLLSRRGYFDSPVGFDGHLINLPKEKKRVRYKEEPEILQGRTPPYSARESEASSLHLSKEFPLLQNYGLGAYTSDYQVPFHHDSPVSSERRSQKLHREKDAASKHNLQPIQVPEHEELIFEDILREILGEEAKNVTKSFVREFANSHLERAAAYDIIMHFVDEIVTDLGPALTEDAKLDAWVDTIQDDALGTCIKEVAMETIVQCQKELIDKIAQETILDEMMLDSLLAKLGKQGKPFTTEETTDLLLDDLILTNLLEQYFNHTQDNGDNKLEHIEP